jgi:hypothetical protein
MRLSPDERTLLAELAQRAAQHPMDMREFTDPIKGPLAKDVMTSLRVQIGTLVIAYSHDRMPPDWHPYRHLSVSDAGKPVGDALFREIGDALGMGRFDEDSFLARLMLSMGAGITARHVFEPLLD